MGHDVAISAFHGQQGGMGEWEGFPVYPAGDHPYGGDVVGLHARHFGASWVIPIMDFWALSTDTLIGLNVAPWSPVDCDPLGEHDLKRHREASIRGLEFRCRPIAFSRFGQRVLGESGFPALYVPHGVDCSLWVPPEDREALREAMGVDDKFVVFMNAANLSKDRKNFAEQMAAFARLHRRHDDTLLVLHTQESTSQGLNLPLLAAKLGISKAVKFSSQYLMKAGMVTAEQLRGSYGMADLYSSCSLAEGFGITVAEAMSCGVPTVVSDNSALTEVGGPCWKVKCDPRWVPGHDSWWGTPRIDDITKVYERAYQRGPAWTAKGQAGRQHVLDNYDLKVVEPQWRAVLGKLEAML